MKLSALRSAQALFRPATRLSATFTSAYRLPAQFASVQGINGAITTLWTQTLPADYYQQYGAKIGAVTKEDVVRVAKQYIDLDHLAIVIVGDRASIEAPLKATGIAPIVVTDIEGNRSGS